MEIQQLKHFLAIVDLGNFARAADRLNITQPGLSRSIKVLEESLQLSLFDRGSRGVRPTEAARMLVPRARSILNERERALREAASLGALRRGQVTVGISTVFNYLVTPDVIARIRAAGMGIDLHVISGPYEQMCERLDTAEMDFAFLLFGQQERHPGLDYEPVVTIDSRVFAGAAHPLHAREQVTVEDLAAQDWILSDNPGFRKVFNDFFAQQGFAPPAVTIAPSSLGLLLLTMARGDLVTILPASFEHLPFGGKVVKASVLPATARAAGGIVLRKGSTPSPAAQAVANLFRAAALAGDQAATG